MILFAISHYPRVDKQKITDPSAVSVVWGSSRLNEARPFSVFKKPRLRPITVEIEVQVRVVSREKE